MCDFWYDRSNSTFFVVVRIKPVLGVFSDIAQGTGSCKRRLRNECMVSAAQIKVAESLPALGDGENQWLVRIASTSICDLM